MKLKNAIMQLEQELGPVKSTFHGDRTEYRSVPPGGRTGIEFSMRPGTDEIFDMRVRVEGDEDDSSVDYRAGMEVNNMERAIWFVRNYCWHSETHAD